MADWLKVLVGTVAGLIVGLLSEPLKAWINAKVKEKTIRDALYTSMADLYGFFAARFDQELRARYPTAFIDSNLEIFDHYFSTEKAAFFRLREAPFLKTFFYLVRNTYDQMNDQTSTQQEEAVRSILYCVKSGLESGSINGKRLRKLLSKGPSWRTTAPT